MAHEWSDLVRELGRESIHVELFELADSTSP